MESTDLTQRLPEDVLAAVLRRLMPHGLAAARCVCKPWHALIDDLIPLVPPSLAGFFISYHELDFSEFFFRPPRDGAPAVSSNLSYVSPAENEDTLVLDHCNGLLLFWSCVVNPATRQWAHLPPPPADHLCPRYIVFDPAISPHYEVLLIPDTGFASQLEWPPSPFIIHVFSSATGNWEDRSFVRQGDAVGTFGQLQQQPKPFRMREHSAYWRGHLYVLHQFVVMRISLSNCTYQAFHPPVHVGTSDQEICLGKSKNGVYFASLHPQYWLRVWILNELHGSEIEWVLKHDNSLHDMLSHGMYDQEVRGPWIIEDINYQYYRSTSPIDTEEGEGDTLKWDSDNENTIDAKLRVREHCGFSFLGFHPYREIVFLSECVYRGLAYHLDSSKIEDLGSIYPKHYVSMGSFIPESFPYTPCWIEELPSSI